jgi:endonuclease/exonuclease/phosphatase family metal-dependent hydrolase
MPLRIATFNMENFDDVPGSEPTLAERIAVMRPQLARVRADILCLQEVHSQGPAGARTLAALEALIAGTPYQTFNRAVTVTTGGTLFDVRNLVILTSFPITSSATIRDSQGPRPSYQMATANPPDLVANVLEWERPILQAQLNIGGGRTLHVLNLHLKSKIATNIPGQKIDTFTWRTASAWAEGSFVSAMKRLGQALQTRLIVDGIFDSSGHDALIALCGDFNADHDEVAMHAIFGRVEDTGNPAHGPRVLVACERNVPEPSRYSLLHLGKGEMLDHIVASRGLLAFFDHAEVHNEILPDESGAFHTDVKFPESDHAPVVAEFTIN